VWSVAEQLAAQAGCLLWTGPFGDGVGVVLDRPAYDTPSVFSFERIEDGENWSGNMLSTDDTVSIREVPTRVISSAHSSLAGPEDTRVRMVRTNDAVLRHPLVSSAVALEHPRYLDPHRAQSPAAAERMADKIFARANARFRQYRCEVRGFAQRIAGRDVLYTVNTMAHVQDDLDEPRLATEMLLTAVQFHHGRRNGQTASLTLSPKGAIRIDADV
jgi:prophage tail gpP-like protein